MANEGKLPHVLVSVIYALLQVLLNIFLLAYIIPGNFNPVWVNVSMGTFFIAIYIPIKYGFSKRVERRVAKMAKHKLSQVK
jgi:hypothetical protein